MAIPFYEPRQQAASECDQVDGNFPPAPSSQAVPMPTANFQSVANAIQTPPVARSYTGTAAPCASTATANLSASTDTRNPSTSPRTSSTISQVTNSSMTANISGPSTPVSSGASNSANAHFTFSSTNHPSSATSFSSNPTNTETPETTFSTTAPATPMEPLPWKLLAVSMCKALKQYYEQTNTPDVFTTAIIEILPSGSPTQSSSAAGN